MFDLSSVGDKQVISHSLVYGILVITRDRGAAEVECLHMKGNV